VSKRTRWVPSAEDDPPVCRVILDLPNAFRKLIDTLSLIIGLTVDVFCAKMSPLEAVDGAQVALGAVSKAARVKKGAGAIAVPNVDILLLKKEGVGRTGDEPQKLLQGGTRGRVSCKVEVTTNCNARKASKSNTLVI
jgi:hypothetical protein